MSPKKKITILKSSIIYYLEVTSTHLQLPAVTHWYTVLCILILLMLL